MYHRDGHHIAEIPPQPMPQKDEALIYFLQLNHAEVLRQWVPPLAVLHINHPIDFVKGQSGHQVTHRLARRDDHGDIRCEELFPDAVHLQQPMALKIAAVFRPPPPLMIEDVSNGHVNANVVRNHDVPQLVRTYGVPPETLVRVHCGLSERHVHAHALERKQAHERRRACLVRLDVEHVCVRRGILLGAAVRLQCRFHQSQSFYRILGIPRKLLDVGRATERQSSLVHRGNSTHERQESKREKNVEEEDHLAARLRVHVFTRPASNASTRGLATQLTDSSPR
eukprot:scaffold214_cov249-Pinguiococcus_pyrenoidosus.AAC.23